MTTTTTTPDATLNRRVLPMLADVASARAIRIQAIRSKAGRYTRAALISMRMASYHTGSDAECPTIRRAAFRSLVRINATLAKLDALSL